MHRTGRIRTRLLRDYSLSLVLAVLFLLSWLLHSFTGWMEFAANSKRTAAEAEDLGEGEEPGEGGPMSSDTLNELAAVREERWQTVERELHAEMRRRAPGQALYWLTVVGGSFVLNLLLLLAIARA